MSGAGFGIAAHRKLHRRAATLALLARFADGLAEQIRATAAPLADVLRVLAQRAEFARLPWWRVVSWHGDIRREVCAAAKETAAETALTVEDTTLLCEFAAGWGSTDLEGEIGRCRQYASLWTARAEDARAEAAQKGSLYVTLGICGGSMLALLLG